MSIRWFHTIAPVENPQGETPGGGGTHVTTVKCRTIKQLRAHCHVLLLTCPGWLRGTSWCNSRNRRLTEPLSTHHVLGEPESHRRTMLAEGKHGLGMGGWENEIAFGQLVEATPVLARFTEIQLILARTDGGNSIVV